MSARRLSPVPPAEAILPIRGGGSHAPGSMLVRAALEGQGIEEPARLRAAVAAVFVLAERARADAGEERFWWQQPVRVSVSEIADDAGLLASEVEGGLGALQAAGLVRASEAGWLLDANVLCEQPRLASVRWPVVRHALLRAGIRLGPAIAVYRELARLGVEVERPVAVRLGELLEATLYGRSAVSQALSDLERAGLLERQDASARQGVRVRLTPRGFAELTEAPAVTPPAGTARLSLAELTFGGHPIRLPAGTPIEVEALPGGQSRVRMGPLVIEEDSDGRQTANWGALRIRV